MPRMVGGGMMVTTVAFTSPAQCRVMLVITCIQVKVFWVVMPCSVVVGHQCLEDLAACGFRVK